MVSDLNQHSGSYKEISPMMYFVLVLVTFVLLILVVLAIIDLRKSTKEYREYKDQGSDTKTDL
ncbi:MULTISPECIES: hypothetical protein [Maribacter]|uniref:Uncharacterized protein n=1 Tax=Maribacter flavus TaxID=1658664 RepID=A0A5B2TX58_9FLAO|nr:MULTISPECIES: hypothetical protein [Maribacter]KAA2219121.1 hypothetical protein F0361_05790 [Maribacter flavus]MDC6404045.1 hypothetical protein [Maribacter sp. PR66]MEE1971186.1 hypothetical protein [Maribacter flavus]